MLKNVKIGTKLGFGFGLLVVVLATLGAVSYYMLGNIDSNVLELNDHNLAAVQGASTAERTVFETLMAEKDYLIYEKDEFEQKARAKLTEVAKCLDEVDQLAAQFSDTSLAQQSKDARATATQFGKAFADAFAASNANRAAYVAMGQKGLSIQNEVDSLATAIEAKYQEAKNEAELVRRVHISGLEMRLNSNRYRLHKDDKYFTAMESTLADLLKSCSELEKAQPEADDLGRLATIRKAATEYLAANKEWSEEDKRDSSSNLMGDLRKKITEKGDTVAKAVDEYFAANKTTMGKLDQARALVAQMGPIMPNARVHFMKYMLDQNQEEFAKLTEQITRLGKTGEDLRKTTALPSHQQKIDQIAKAAAEYQTMGNSWLQNDKKLRGEIFPQLRQCALTMLASVQAAQTNAWSVAANAQSSVLGTISNSRMVIICSLLAGIAVAIVAAVVITRGITRPLAATLKVLQTVSGGDYTTRLEVKSRDEIGQMATALNTTIAAIEDVMRQISESAAQFTEGSRVIAESSQTLASGAQQQSSSVEEMTASIEELARSIQSVKDNAIQADQVAKRTNQLADQGGQAVQKSIEAMNLIKTSSTQIGEIIQVISEIASQTNLLALNAAIEAARAGEHGMGFAVVADEVRKLAERSNQAAREISTLIKESTQRVEEGSQLSDQTGQSLKEILEGVGATVAKISEIATATVQQAANADEVSKAIQGVAQVTEQSAAGSEEMASSSEELGAQAVALREMVSRFKLTSTV